MTIRAIFSGIVVLALGLAASCSPGRLEPGPLDGGGTRPGADAGTPDGPQRPMSSLCDEQGGMVCQPYEVCDGTPETIADTHRCCSGTCRLPKTFDWRTRHGQNWNSPVRDQGQVGACSYFGAMAAIEAAINLYYNQRLDIDLSEQAFWSCSADIYRDREQSDGVNRCLNLTGPTALLCKARFKGIPDEACFPFISDVSAFYDSECDAICDDYESRMWRVTDFIQLLGDEYFAVYVLDEQTNQFVYKGVKPDRPNQKYLNAESLKRHIILYGPVNGVGVLENHSAAIVGWGVDGENPQGDEPSWIIKNSWGEAWKDAGYGTTPRTLDDFSEVGVVVTPIIPPPGHGYSIRCEDQDDDNFCNWGISPARPDACPSDCKSAKDWDDSDPQVGALGRY